MAKKAENIVNIFSFIPKEISSEAFFTWLLNFLDSSPNCQMLHQVLFNRLILKQEDVGRGIKFVSIMSNGDGKSAILTFRFNGSDSEHNVLLVFGDAINAMDDYNKLRQYSRMFPKCYRYFYYKIKYVNTFEEQIVSSEQFDLISAGMMETILGSMEHLDHQILSYKNYLRSEADSMNRYHEKIFLQHDKYALQEGGAQKYLFDAVMDNIAEDNWNIKFQ